MRRQESGVLGLMGALLGVLSAFVAGCAGTGRDFAGTFRHAAVAADHEVASRAGLEVLRRGGNAVDAAVATSFTLSVVRPESCGIGGGGFMVIRFSEAGVRDQRSRGRDVPRQVALNYREMAPWGVGAEFFEKIADKTASTHGGKAVGIPGTVAGLLTAHERYGAVDRATVLAPAIRAAEEGFVADEHYAAACKETTEDFEKNPAWKERFRFVWVRLLCEGKVKRGDRIVNPEQAAALRLIAEQGAAAFYQGPIAQAIIEAVRRDGGVMTHEDLSRFRVSSTDPLTFEALGKTFVTMPPPSSGGVAMGEALQIAQRMWSLKPDQPVELEPVYGVSEATGITGLIEHFRVAAQQNPVYVHPLIESLKHAFADRSEWLGDPAFVTVPTDRLLSTEYASSLAATYNPERTLSANRYGSRETAAVVPDDGGTSHFSIVDGAGNAVACTETINLGFGSCLAVDRFGFILNDQMDDFTTRRGQVNAFGLRQSDRNLPAAGKRPLSSMTPTIVLDAEGRVEVIAGASGGPRIITGTMQAICNVLMFEMPAWQAVESPRVHHQWSPNVVRIEGELYDRLVKVSNDNPEAPTLIGRLQDRGHRVERIDDVGNVQLIRRVGAGWEAACDPRKGGRPAGY
jgi:gamma-glutamyltranspeptidase / glutathione hydrolase